MSFQEYSESRFSRHHWGGVNRKLLFGAIALVVAVIACIVIGVAGSGGGESALVIESAHAPQAGEAQAGDEGAATPADATVCVHVGGCVNAPGVYRLDEGDRVSDAVELAGGMTPEAAPDAINLARVLVDGEQVIVASVTDVAVPTEGARSATGSSASSPSGADTSPGGKVNINTATSEQLQTISGIGESKAKKIIDYREKVGPFKSVDDLTNVSGIGAKTLEGMRDQICV